MRLLPLMLIPTLFLTAAAAPDGRDRGPGVVGQREGDALVYRVAGFDQVSVGTAGTVDVRVGPAFSIRISGPAEALANLRVIRVERGLDIGRRWEGRQWTAADKKVRIAITLPRLAEFTLGGSGEARIDQVSGAAFESAVGGSGTLTIGNVAVRKAEFALGGSGNIAAAGATDDLTVSIGGSGQFRGQRLRVRGASVSVGGSGGVVAAVDGQAHVSIAGSGSVDLGPRARCSISKVGSGRVRCGG